MEAFEALNIATINVASVGLMLTGGLLYAFDISSLDDMKRNVRTRIGVDVERSDQEVEKEIEEWFATVLERMGKNEKKVEVEEQDSRDQAKERRENEK